MLIYSMNLQSMKCTQEERAIVCELHFLCWYTHTRTHTQSNESENTDANSKKTRQITKSAQRKPSNLWMHGQIVLLKLWIASVHWSCAESETRIVRCKSWSESISSRFYLIDAVGKRRCNRNMNNRKIISIGVNKKATTNKSNSKRQKNSIFLRQTDDKLQFFFLIEMVKCAAKKKISCVTYTLLA